MERVTPQRNPADRLKNLNGTVHWAKNGKPVCGKLATHSTWLAPSVATVTCERCINIWGGDVAGHTDAPVVNEYRARRDAERAARMAARNS